MKRHCRERERVREKSVNRGGGGEPKKKAQEVLGTGPRRG